MNNRYNLILRAARREPVERTPVWLMRQAGRYQPEFRAIRQKYDFLTLCKTPEKMVEVSLLPVQQLDIDGAIIFFDLLLPCEAMGSHLEYLKGEGPVIHNPIRSAADVQQLGTPDPTEANPALGQAIQWLKRELAGSIPVLGFTGAPWTMAAYMIEGGGSSHYTHIKRMMYQEPVLFDQLQQRISTVLVDYLCYQIESGAELVQLFDTWVGHLSLADYRRFALPYTQQVIAAVKQRCPQAAMVLYVNTCSHLLSAMVESGADVLSLDWRVDLAAAWQQVGHRVALQGNLDPTLLFAPKTTVEAAAQALLAAFPAPTGHIFNLGHGILPETPVENVQALVRTVQQYRRPV